jgi:peptide/nickel transport system permease protein
MLKNVLSKIFYALLTLLGVVSLVFFLFNVLPGDPAQMMLGQNENSDQLAMVKKKIWF